MMAPVSESRGVNKTRVGDVLGICGKASHGGRAIGESAAASIAATSRTCRRKPETRCCTDGKNASGAQCSPVPTGGSGAHSGGSKLTHWRVQLFGGASQNTVTNPGKTAGFPLLGRAFPRAENDGHGQRGEPLGPLRQHSRTPANRSARRCHALPLPANCAEKKRARIELDIYPIGQTARRSRTANARANRAGNRRATAATRANRGAARLAYTRPAARRFVGRIKKAR